MHDHYFLGFYWSSRSELPESIAGRLLLTLDLLSTIDQSLGAWYLTAKPKKGVPIVAINNTKEELCALILKNEVANDLSEEPNDLGYILMLKSDPNFGTGHTLSLTAGATHHRIVNCVLYR